MLHTKQLNSKKTRFPRFDKILVIQRVAEVYGESNERQLCKEIDPLAVTGGRICIRTMHNPKYIALHTPVRIYSEQILAKLL